MAEKSGIDWLKRGDLHGNTWNPWFSCQHAMYVGSDGKEHVHPGCLHCYAENQMDTIYNKCVWGGQGTRVRTTDDYWRKLEKYDRAAKKAGVLLPVFPSLCDPLESWSGIIVNAKGQELVKCRNCGEVLPGIDIEMHRNVSCPWDNFPQPRRAHSAYSLTMDDLRTSMFGKIRALTNIEFILFTKRPQNIAAMFPADERFDRMTLCYSASNQETWDWGVPILIEHGQDRAGVLGVSLEPFLAPVKMNLPWIRHPDGRIEKTSAIDWVIIGVESNGNRVGRYGDKSTPGHFMDQDSWWAGCEDIVTQCAEAGVPCYVKQGPINGRVSHDPNEWPAACRVRQFPRPQHSLQAV